MEHRYSIRRKTDLKAIVFKDGFQIAFGRIINTSQHGLFLKCAIQNFWRNQPVEVELFVTNGSPYSIGRFKCFLSRIEAQGLALAIFDEHQQRYAEKIRVIENNRTAAVIHADGIDEQIRIRA